MDYARHAINVRNCKQGAWVARYLAVVRDLYRQFDDEAGWHGVISGIREESRRLPALQDELNKAKL